MLAIESYELWLERDVFHEPFHQMTQPKDEVLRLAIGLAVPEVHFDLVTQEWKREIDVDLDLLLEFDFIDEVALKDGSILCADQDSWNS